MGCKSFSLFIYLIPFFIESFADSQQYFFPRRPVISSYRREISSSIKWHGIRCKENIQGPTTTPRHCLYGIHVYMIKVRPLFSINFYIDKMFIHNNSCRFVFKTFFFHDMTPMTGRIANADKNWFVFFPGKSQSFITPGIPMNRVMCMLQQIRTCFI